MVLACVEPEAKADESVLLGACPDRGWVVAHPPLNTKNYRRTGQNRRRTGHNRHFSPPSARLFFTSGSTPDAVEMAHNDSHTPLFGTPLLLT